MDQGDGQFEQFETMKDLIEKHPERYDVKDNFNDKGIFSVGEIIELKGSRFRVKNIKPDKLILKLLPK